MAKKKDTSHLTLERTTLAEGDRMEVKGQRFRAIRNDSVLEFAVADRDVAATFATDKVLIGKEGKQIPACTRHAENSFDMLLTSIPFGNQYEYTTLENDMGHNYSNEAFFQQMDFLVPNLLRVLKP